MLGHLRRSMECPACAELSGAEKQPEETWRWFRTRTSSKRIKARIDERLEGFAVHGH
jgi:hypothetical protein